MSWIALLLAFAPLVIVPLGLRVLGMPPPLPFTLATVAPLVSLLLPVGPAAGAIATIWFAACAAITVGPALAWLRRPRWDAGLVALAYLCVGAGWLVMSRAGVRVSGFGPTIVELTAVHFHYAGFAALVLAARHTVAAALVAGGTVLVAVGHFGTHELDVAGAAALTAGLLALGWSTWRTTTHPLLRISAATPVVSMALALAYALGRIDVGPSVPIDDMARFHGTLNAFGFALAGLVGRLLVAR